MKLIKALTALAAMVASVLVTPTAAQAAAPKNDDFRHATRIAFSQVKTSSTAKATRAADDPSCGGAGTIWYSYKPTMTRTIVASAAGSDFPSVVGAYVGTRGALTEIACNNGAWDYTGAVQIRVVKGTRYYFMVAGYDDSSSGSVQFSLLTQPTLSVTFASRGTVDPDPDSGGWVALHGTYSCDRPGFLEIYATGVQGDVGSRLGENYLGCPGHNTPFEIGFRSWSEPFFSAGRVLVTYDAHQHAYTGGQIDVYGTRKVWLSTFTSPALR